MTFGEFKAWLEGYEAAFAFPVGTGTKGKIPNYEQWQMILNKLEEVIVPVVPQLITSPLGTNPTSPFPWNDSNRPMCDIVDQLIKGEYK